MDELRQKLITNAAKIAECRKLCLDAKTGCIDKKEKLNDQIAGLFNNGMIVGKNDKERDASMRSQTIRWRDAVIDSERAERIEMLNLELALDERRLLESLLKIEEIKR